MRVNDASSGPPTAVGRIVWSLTELSRRAIETLESRKEQAVAFHALGVIFLKAAYRLGMDVEAGTSEEAIEAAPDIIADAQVEAHFEDWKTRHPDEA